MGCPSRLRVLLLLAAVGCDGQPTSTPTLVAKGGPATATMTYATPPPPPPTPSPQCSLTAAQVIKTMSQLSAYAAHLDTTGTTAVLQSTTTNTPFTIIAPTDAGFAALPTGHKGLLDSDNAILTKVIRHTVLYGTQLSANALGAQQQVTTSEGSALLTAAGPPVTVGGTALAATDECAVNGVLHTIDTVLFPSSVTLPSADAAGAIAAHPSLTKYTNAMRTIGYESSLKGAGPLTLFAASDSAFAALDPGQESALLNDPATFTKVLQYTTVSGYITLKTLQTNAPSSLTPLYGVGLEYSLDSNTGNVVLRKGVVGGDSVVGQSVTAVNGIVHIVDKLVFPPGLPLPPPLPATAVPATPVPPTPAPAPPDPTTLLMRIAEGRSSLSITVGHLKGKAVGGRPAALLEQPGPFTVFLPSDSAWNALPSGLAEFFNDNPSELEKTLLYHIVEGRKLLLADLVAASPVVTKEGGTAVVTEPTPGEYRIAGGRITSGNGQASNGILHEVSAVLLPPSSQAPQRNLRELVAMTPQLSRFSEVVSRVFNGAETLQQAGPVTVFAPSNEAWERLTTRQYQTLTEGTELLKVFENHLHLGYLSATDMSASPNTIPTLRPNNRLAYERDAVSGLTVKPSYTVPGNAAKVTETDLWATNGILHIVDRILLPSDVTLPNPSLWEVVTSTPEYSEFAAMAKRASFGVTLQGGSEKTLFLPTNAAWERLSSGIREALRRNAGELLKVLSHHCITGQTVPAGRLLASSPLRTAEGTSLSIAASAHRAGGLAVSGVDIIKEDLYVTDGVIHVIDFVLIPDKASLPSLDSVAVLERQQTLSDFVNALVAVGMTTRLRSGGPYTIFTPSNDAIRRTGRAWNLLLSDRPRLERVLRYHVVPRYLTLDDLVRSAPGSLETADDGATWSTTRRSLLQLAAGSTRLKYDVTDGNSLRLNEGQGKVESPDLYSTNGIVHVVDGLLYPAELPAMSTVTISRYIASVPGLTNLTSFLAPSPLLATLSRPGDFTLFAPTNEAFAALPAGHLEVLRRRPDMRDTVLKMHVVGSSMLLASAVSQSPVTALEGTVQASSGGGLTLINSVARVVQEDVLTSNGVVHSIDTVLLPSDPVWVRQLPTQSVFEVLQSHRATVGTFLRAVLKCSDCAALLQQPGSYTVFAPRDTAFTKWSNEKVAEVLGSEERSRQMVLQHVAQTYIHANDSSMVRVDTLGSLPVVANTASGVLVIEEPQVASAETQSLPAMNGIVHILNAPLGDGTKADGDAGGDDDDGIPWWVFLIIGLVLLLLLVALLIWLCLRKKKAKKTPAGKSLEYEFSEVQKTRSASAPENPLPLVFPSPQAAKRNVIDIAPSDSESDDDGKGRAIRAYPSPSPTITLVPASPQAQQAYNRRVDRMME